MERIACWSFVMDSAYRIVVHNLRQSESIATEILHCRLEESSTGQCSK